MIKLSKRLEKIASFINEEDDVLDIGCDHALLDIYLSKKYNKIYYASDLRESALDMARSNIKKYNSDKVILKCGNGLDVLDVPSVLVFSDGKLNSIYSVSDNDYDIDRFMGYINNIKLERDDI